MCIIELASNIKFSSYSQLLDRIEKLEASVVSGDIKPSSVAPAPVFKPSIKHQEPEFSQASQQAVQKEEPAPVNKDEQMVEPEIQQHVPTVEQLEPAKPQASAPAAAGQDLASAWQGILQNIDSIPSRMFFYNLSKPLELTPQGVTIAFMKEIFVKQAQEDSKNAPLKKAAMNYFGVDDINIHIKLADSNDVPAVKPALENLERKTPQTSSVQVSNAVDSSEEENAQLLKETFQSDVKETTVQKSSDDIPEHLSEQSKMVVELFNGKYIE